MRGRKPKPTALHLLHGTFRRDRHGQRIDAPQEKADETLLIWRTYLKLPERAEPEPEEPAK